MKYQRLCILLILFFSACSSTLFIKNDESAYKELNNKLEGKECEIALTNGDVYICSDIDIDSELSSWFESNSLNKIIVKLTKEIKKITFYNTSTGADKGSFLGVILGGVLGGLIGFNASPLNGEYFETLFTVLGSAIGIVGGGLLGGTFGAIKADKNIYILNTKNEIQNEPKIIQVLEDSTIEKSSLEIFTIEVHSIIKETEKSLTVLWGIKEIEIPKSEIMKKIENENKILIKISKESYITYFE